MPLSITSLPPEFVMRFRKTALPNHQAWYAIPASWFSSGSGTHPSLEHRLQYELLRSFYKDCAIVSGIQYGFWQYNAATYLATWAYYNCNSNDVGLLQPISLPAVASTILVPKLLAIGALDQKEGVQKLRELCGGEIAEEILKKIWMHLEVVREVAFWLAAVKEQFPVIEEEKEEGPVLKYPPKPKKHGCPPGGKPTFPKSGHGTLAKYRSWYSEELPEAEASNEGSKGGGAGRKFTDSEFKAQRKAIMGIRERIKYRRWYQGTLPEAKASNEGSNGGGANRKFTDSESEAPWEDTMGIRDRGKLYRWWDGTLPEAEASNEGSKRGGADGKVIVRPQASWEKMMVSEILTEDFTDEDFELI